MDPRVPRTRESLQNALLDLAREHSLDEITVGDIASRAGVNRSSFYQHYSDKETLLADALERTIVELSETLGVPSVAEEGTPMPPELAQYLEHVAANVALYRRVLGPHGSAVVAGRLSERIEQVVRAAIEPHLPGPFAGVPVDVVAAGISGSAMGVIAAWVSRDPLPPVDTAAGWLWAVLTHAGATWVEEPVSPPAARKKVTDARIVGV